MSRRLNGAELEEWFKDVARKAGILNETPFELEKTVRLFDEKLNHRLSWARTSIHKYFPDGEDWIDRTLHRRAIPNISAQLKHEFANRLADLVIGIDLVLQVKNTGGNTVQIAVDVTSNDREVDNKLRKVRGFSLPSSASKANKNIPLVREELGIDKHLVVLLERTPGRLPSTEKLLDVIYAFAESTSLTRKVDLTNLDTKDRTNWRQVEAADPARMWQKYTQGINSKASSVVALEAAKRAFKDNHSLEAILNMLTEDPQYRQFLRRDSGDRKAADTYAQSICTGAETAVASESSEQSQAPRVQGPQL